jgi:hypothetical protein
VGDKSEQRRKLEAQRERRRRGQQERRRLRAGLLEWKVFGAGEFKCRMVVPVKRACEHCGAEFKPQRTTARFCSTKCRVYASRAKAKGG